MPFPLLLIDDDPTVTDALSRSLILSFDVEVANSGDQAMEMIQAGGEFPVVVTDLRMPNMDGIQFIKEARQFLPNSVYIVLTGNHDVRAGDYIDDSGLVFLTIQKPAKKADLISKIEMAYGKHLKDCSCRVPHLPH